jgi:hypothetical protein
MKTVFHKRGVVRSITSISYEDGIPCPGGLRLDNALFYEDLRPSVRVDHPSPLKDTLGIKTILAGTRFLTAFGTTTFILSSRVHRGIPVFYSS